MTQDPDQSMVGVVLAPTLAVMIASNQADDVKKAVAELRDPELADILIQLEPETCTKVFRLIKAERSAEIFSLLPQDVQEELLALLRDREISKILDQLEPDDRVELLEDIENEEQYKRLLGMLKPADREEAEQLLSYPDESVGREMTTRFLTVESNWSAQRIIDHMREVGKEIELFTYLYVIDDYKRLLGSISFKEVLLSDPKTRARVMMQDNPKRLNVMDDRETAVRAMDRYDEPILPVVDERDRLVGIVTFDDVAEVANEEFTEDIHKMGGMEALEQPYVSTGILKMIRKRGIWLVFLFLGQMGTITVLGVFQGIVSAGILAIFIPLIISSGGNSGSQATNMIIRSLSIGELRLGDWFKVLRKELTTGIIMGSILGVLGLSRVLFGQWIHMDPHEDFMVALGFTVGTALVGVVILGTSLGSMLPFLLKRFKVDPATASGPFVATMVDVTGLIIYCITALLLMPKVQWMG